MYSITVQVKSAEELLKVVKSLTENTTEGVDVEVEETSKKPKKVKLTPRTEETKVDAEKEETPSFIGKKLAYEDASAVTVKLAAISRDTALGVLAKFKSKEDGKPATHTKHLSEADWGKFIEEGNSVLETQKEAIA